MRKVFLMMVAIGGCLVINTAGAAKVRPVMTVGFLFGGDAIAELTTGEELNAGGFIYIAGGIEQPFFRGSQTKWRVTLGFLHDSLDASNGEAKFIRYPLDVLAVYDAGNDWQFIGGLTLHLAPDYSITVNGSTNRPDISTPIGLVAEIDKSFSDGFQMGLRATFIDYQAHNSVFVTDTRVSNVISGNSLGLMFNLQF